MKKTMIAMMALGLVTLSAQAAAINWGSSLSGFQNSEGAALEGGYVQLVYAGSDDQIGLGTVGDYNSDIDMSNAAGDYVAGDDFVVATALTGSGKTAGQAVVNHGYTWGATTDTGINQFTTGDQFYIRVWDSSDPTSAANYNQTGLYSLTAVNNTGTDEFYLTSNLQTTQPVPEPGTIMLALAGAGALLAKRRKSKKSA